MAKLTAAERASLPDRAFAYIDSKGRRRLPIHDESHVRNALARFDQVKFESQEAREAARDRLLKAAKRHGIMPIGFIARQLRPPELPEGVVTLLFTDIEGSTAHLRELGEEYEAVLDQVRGVIRRAVKAAGGLEVEARADETFSVFEDGAAAVEAAIALQRALAKAAWPGSREVRVRAGVHRGTVRLTSNGYIGLAVHKAARICAAAHGGQIVASGEASTGLARRTLGRYELAGLSGSHTLYQIDGDGPAVEFPELRA